MVASRCANDGKAMLQLLQSSKVYRVEARPLLFSQNANRLVHVTGYFGSVVEVEDPQYPQFCGGHVGRTRPQLLGQAVRGGDPQDHWPSLQRQSPRERSA